MARKKDTPNPRKRANQPITNQSTNQPTNRISFQEARSCYLSDTEICVLKLVADGFTCREIAARTGNKPSTIQTHRRNIKKKLGLNGHRTLERWCRKYEDQIKDYSI